MLITDLLNDHVKTLPNLDKLKKTVDWYTKTCEQKHVLLAKRVKNSDCHPLFQNETVLKSLSSNKDPNNAGTVKNYIGRSLINFFWGSDKSEKYSEAINLVGSILFRCLISLNFGQNATSYTY